MPVCSRACAPPTRVGSSSTRPSPRASSFGPRRPTRLPAAVPRATAPLVESSVASAPSYLRLAAPPAFVMLRPNKQTGKATGACKEATGFSLAGKGTEEMKDADNLDNNLEQSQE